MKQCLGTTVKGEPCKIKTDKGYCRHHAGQARSPQSRSLPQHSATSRSTDAVRPNPDGSDKSLGVKNKGGFIYIYTYARLLEDDKPWLKVQNIPGTRASKKNKLVPFNAAKSDYMLVKIGMTTQTVAKRLRQWQEKCRHKIVEISPPTNVLATYPSSESVSRLRALFSKLSLKNSSPAKPHIMRTFQPDQRGWYSPRNVAEVEASIHKQLRAQYGYGDIQCTGCKNPDKPGQQYNIHIEWFLVPKSHLRYVFQLIDTTCYQLNYTNTKQYTDTSTCSSA